VLVAGADFFKRKVLLVGAGWLVLVLCEREYYWLDAVKMKRTKSRKEAEKRRCPVGP